MQVASWLAVMVNINIIADLVNIETEMKVIQKGSTQKCMRSHSINNLN